MKRFRLSVAVLLTAWSLIGTEGAFAQQNTEVSKVKVVKSETKKVRLYTPVGLPVSVALIDADGNILFQDNVKAKDARGLSFNMNTLPDGQYFLTTTNDAFWLSQPMTVRGNKLTIDAQTVSQLEKPTLVAYDKNKFEVKLPASNVRSVEVAIYDQQNVLVYADDIAGTKSHRFDLSTLPSGDYTFVVGPVQKKFAERIAIKR